MWLEPDRGNSNIAHGCRLKNARERRAASLARLQSAPAGSAWWDRGVWSNTSSIVQSGAAGVPADLVQVGAGA